MRLRSQGAKRTSSGSTLLSVLAWVAMSAGAAPAAWAGVDLYGPTAVGGYSSDSSQSNPHFGAAVAGEALTVLTFTEESDGTPIDLYEPPYNGQDGSLPGDIFSDEVWFGSPDYANPNLLNPSSRIGLTGIGGPFDSDPDSYKIYPLPAFSGRLEIDFASASTAVSAVGVGLYGSTSGLAQTIRVYDRDGDEITTLFSDTLGANIPAPYTYSGPTGQFVFIGLVATSEEDWIGRVVIDGSAYEVQDVSFVPEPATGLGATVALLSVFGLAARQRRR